MTAGALLGLWRERWRKARGLDLYVPYQGGSAVAWLERARKSRFWSLPGAASLVHLGVLIFLMVTPGVGLTLNGQILFSGLLVAAAVLVRRFAGPVCALALVTLSVIATGRYLAWRLNQTWPDRDVEMVLALVLWTTEVLVALYWMLRLADFHWPLYREPKALPASALQWPILDVVIPCGELSEDAVRHALQTARAQSWPENRLHLHLIVPQDSEQWIVMAQQEGVRWYPQAAVKPLWREPSWLAQCTGTHLLIVEQGVLPDGFLQACTGALLDEEGPLCLVTPDSAQAPPPLQRTGLRLGDGAPALCLVQRTAWMAVCVERTSEPARARLNARTSGLIWALGSGAGVTTPQWWQLDGVQSDWQLRLRLNARALRDGLRFYAPLAQIVAALAPVLCLGAGWAPVKTTWIPLLAYGLTHGLMLRLAWAAQDRRGRLPMMQQWREWILEQVMLWRTAQALVRTWAQYALARRCWAPSPSVPNIALPPWMLGRELLVLALYGVVVLQLLVHPPGLRDWTQTLFALYVVWGARQVCESLARLAVAKEAALVQREAARRAVQEVLVTVGPGRLARGQIREFPQTTLTVRWSPQYPLGLPIDPGDRVSLSVIHLNREHTFEALAQTRGTEALTLTILPQDLKDYHAFGAAVFSREADWPGWLPARPADQILPDWVHRLYATVESVFYDFVIARTGLQPYWRRLQAWVGPGTSQHG